MAGWSEYVPGRIRATNTVLFNVEGFTYDIEGFNKGKKETGYLNYLLDTKKGDCYSLANLYLAVAQRLGYPIFPVVVPAHYFVRYVDPMGPDINLDPTRKGASFGDDRYRDWLSISDKAVQNGGTLDGGVGKYRSKREPQ